jgi:hypothetical protein
MESLDEYRAHLNARRNERPFYDADGLQDPEMAYVCWVDVMGAGSTLRRSASLAANAIVKFHDSVLRWRQENEGHHVNFYPALDGVYAVTTQFHDLMAFLGCVFVRNALGFILDGNPLHRNMIRAGVAYGPVYQGHGGWEGSARLRDSEYGQRILFGIALAQAYEAERRSAPPFGIAIDESARAFAAPDARVLAGLYWRWWVMRSGEAGAKDRTVARALQLSLEEHYDWLEAHPHELSYPADRSREHRQRLQEYFDDIHHVHSD